MILREQRNCCALAAQTAAGVLVDARAYYRAFYHAAERARRRIVIAGWQFDSDVPLLRGDERAPQQTAELLPFLEQLVARNPELEIWILAWDYSLVYALERQWMQRLIFDWTTSNRIHFRFDDAHAVGASHHQKFVVIDGELAFVGGIDLCQSRWDDPRHLPVNPDRINREGAPDKPYHDVMGFVRGDAARALEVLFDERWRRSGGEKIPLELVENADLGDVDGALPLSCGTVGISRTRGASDSLGLARLEEILRLYEDAIAAAEQLIYIETQYFTATAVQKALLRRMVDRARPTLDVVLVMPKMADSPKEDRVLGTAQNVLLASLCRAAIEYGHRLRAYYSSSLAGEEETPTFIHSKLLLVDDVLLSIGSANLTNRSMHLDSELNLTWECERGGDLSSSIRAVRASLLAEHTGIEDRARFEPSADLVERLDALARDPESRLRVRPLPPAEAGGDEHLLQLAFDPIEPLDEIDISDLVNAEKP